MAHLSRRIFAAAVSSSVRREAVARGGVTDLWRCSADCSELVS